MEVIHYRKRSHILDYRNFVNYEKWFQSHFIYVLVDPRTNVVRYVGCTEDAKKRAASHASHPIRSTKEWVKELRDLGLKPQLRVIDTVPYHMARDVECAHIRSYMEFSNGQLLNRADLRTWEESFLRNKVREAIRADRQRERMARLLAYEASAGFAANFPTEAV